MSSGLRALGVLAVALVLGGVGRAEARAPGLKAALAPDRVAFDGVPGEFDGEMRELGYALEGEAKRGDAAARALLAYDAEAIYVGAEVDDDELVAGRDHLSLLLGIPGGILHEIELYPGAPGKSRAEVKVRGRAVAGAKIVEAPRDGGFTLEAKIPWSSLPKSNKVRIGYRGALMYYDVDGARLETVLSTAGGKGYDDLPPISLAAELALGSGLLRQRNLTSPPRYNLMADVVGDGLLERVLVYDRFVVVLGPGYRGGEQYYFRDLGTADLVSFELRDLTGDGRDEVFLRKRVKGSRGEVEVVEILSYHGGGEAPEAIFAQEVKLALSGGGTIENELKIAGRGASTRIELTAGRDEGIDRARFERSSSTGAAPVLVPWEGVAAQIFALEGSSFAMVNERTKTPERVTAVPAPPPPPRPAPRATPAPAKANESGAVWEKKPSREPDLEQVYDLYKKRAKVSGKPRWDLSVDLAEGAEAERLVVHDRDLVVFGAGFRDGRGFAAITLSHFDQAQDLTRVSTRDVTRDGKHEVIVHGIVRAAVPSDAGGGEMQREVVMIYKLRGGQFERIFAAEVGRRLGDKRIEAKVHFGKTGIDLTPGRAVGYDERSYPWKQRSEPDGIFEPLLLPWGGIERVSLHYDGTSFVRRK